MKSWRKWLVLSLLTVSNVGCVKYTAMEKSPTGTFYPNHCANVRGRSARNTLSAQSKIATICQPVKISEFGYADYTGTSNGNDGVHEVARIEFSDDSLYIWTESLKQFGEIKYDEAPQSDSSRVWMFISDHWFRILGFIGIGLGLVVWGFIFAAGSAIFGGGASAVGAISSAVGSAVGGGGGGGGGGGVKSQAEHNAGQEAGSKARSIERIIGPGCVSDDFQKGWEHGREHPRKTK